PSDDPEILDATNNTDNPELGSRKLPFGKHLYIEKADFVPEKPNKHWKRLAKGVEVRLLQAYFIKCNEIVYDENGDIRELLCTFDEKTKSGSGFNERKPNGNIHFVEATRALPATFNLFESLLTDSDGDLPFKERLNPSSWEIKKGFVEPELKDTKPGDKYQFIRNGYYVTDYDSKPDGLVFNRIVGLKGGYR
ncbi:MAG TPA: hypothetical protein P5042_02300, partial [Candidatus Izemoplasmatales bacterium]|nr:hypothetical protein [Candidatus Izemoplasmatales bacterium]